ncbi:MAG: MFS transporter [Proteobacteria bacterium]|nr:MFS transporter [Pseudomonadota bacterium]
MQKNFLIILLTVFIDFIGVGLVIPIFAPLFLSSSSSLFEPNTPENLRNILLGVTLATFPFFQFFGAPILGALSDKFGRKKILFISLAGTFIGYIMTVIGISHNNLVLILLSRMIDGFTGGNISVATSAISDISKPEDKTKNFGLLGAIFGICFILGPFLGGILSSSNINENFNFSTPFLIAGALSFINLILVGTFFKETLSQKIEKTVTLTSGLRNLKKAL